MKDKKNIVLLIVSVIVFCIALVFAIWSFNIDQTIAKQEQYGTNEEFNSTAEIENKTNVIQTENAVMENFQEESKTKDFETTYKDFTAQDIEGNTLKLSDYQNQPVVILFWNEENQDSIQMLNKLNDEYENYKNQIAFIAICTEEYKEKQEIQVPIYEDINGEIINLYGVTELPTIIYISKENEVFNAKTGLTTTDALQANLDILAENF